MVVVPGGSFTMGGVNSQQDADETPPHVVALDAFFIDSVEVTNAQFARFADGSAYQTDAEKAGDSVTWRTFNSPDRQRFPVTYVSWNDAARCMRGWASPSRMGKNRAASRRIYPWGNTFNSAKANTFELGAGQPLPNATNSRPASRVRYDRQCGSGYKTVH
jgi:formylglycine-generating enzyme required for sulfatase activity